MLKKLPSILFLCAVSVWAANFWDSKVYTEWSDNEVDTMLKDSPWGDRMAVRTGEQGVVAKSDDGKPPIMGELEAQVTLLWQTALPVRQALARRQFKDDQEKAKALIDRQTDAHVLLVAGLPGSTRAAAGNKEQLMADTVIKIKNKPDLKPIDIQMPGAAPAGGKDGAPGAKGGGGGRGGGKGGGGGTFDLYFVFPKSAGISQADNELEFVTKLNKITLRKKYKLKDMVFNGKFEM